MKYIRKFNEDIDMESEMGLEYPFVIFNQSNDYEIELEFSSYDYDFELPSEESCEDKFERICDIFGFSSFDLEYRKAKVIFEY